MRWLLLALAAVLAASAQVQAQGQVQTPAPGPAPGPPRIVGGAGAGCIAGAVELPPTGPGFETIRMSRSTFWGHPNTVAGLQLLAARARAAGLPSLYVNDLSLPRGGPMLGTHASHMNGLDADVWLDVGPKPALTRAERDAVEPKSLVSADRRGVDPDRWRPAHLTLIRLAAGLPGIDRILVNPAIKQQLCRDAAGDRGWLHPELPAAALRPEVAELAGEQHDAYVSSNRTCEIGLSRESGQDYRSVVHLLEEATRPGGAPRP